MKKILLKFTALICTLALCLTPVSALSVEQALDLLEQNYIETLPAAAYEAETLDELFNVIGDPYTFYMSNTQNDAFNSFIEAEDSVNGIGVVVEFTAQGIHITALLDGGGAKDAGLKVDDYIIAVEGVSCVPADNSHRSLILGEPGTTVSLTVRHSDGTEQQYNVQRRTVSIHNTLFRLVDGVGMIDCSSFGSQTDEYFRSGFAEHNDQVTHWVVDLRDNLGGYANAAVGVIGAFTGTGPKLFYRLADGSSNFTAYLIEADTEKPAIILVNSLSASSSEVTALGVRAEGKGIVIGSRTYGKGTSQLVLNEDNMPELFHGDSLKITAFRFYAANGDTTDRIGVLPTLLVHDEYTTAVAALLSPQQPQSGRSLRLELDGISFYVDLDKACSGENAAALSELFSALAPDANVYCFVDGAERALTPEAAAKHFGLDYTSRCFRDTAVSPYATQINTLATYGLLLGDGTGRFNPSNKLTRAELSSMLANVLNVLALRSMGFEDVAEGQWYAPSVNAMALLGFMEGNGNGRFDPNGTLTQEQFITVMGRLTRFLNFRYDDYALLLDDEDLEAYAQFHPWARTSTAVLTNYRGNMLYTDLSYITPSDPVTREQAAATLCNILKTLDILSY